MTTPMSDDRFRFLKRLARADDAPIFAAELMREAERAREAEAAYRDDLWRGLRRAHQLTLETQTCEEACADLVRLVFAARNERDRLQESVFGLQEMVNELEDKLNDRNVPAELIDGLRALTNTVTRDPNPDEPNECLRCTQHFGREPGSDDEPGFCNVCAHEVAEDFRAHGPALLAHLYVLEYGRKPPETP